MWGWLKGGVARRPPARLGGRAHPVRLRRTAAVTKKSSHFPPPTTKPQMCSLPPLPPLRPLLPPLPEARWRAATAAAAADLQPLA